MPTLSPLWQSPRRPPLESFHKLKRCNIKIYYTYPKNKDGNVHSSSKTHVGPLKHWREASDGQEVNHAWAADPIFRQCRSQYPPPATYAVQYEKNTSFLWYRQFDYKGVSKMKLAARIRADILSERPRVQWKILRRKVIIRSHLYERSTAYIRLGAMYREKQSSLPRWCKYKSYHGEHEIC